MRFAHSAGPCPNLMFSLRVRKEANVRGILGSTFGPFGDVLKQFSVLGGTLGAPWVHFWGRKTAWGTKSAPRAAKRRRPRNPLTFWEHFGVPKSIHNRSKMGVKRDAKNHNEKKQITFQSNFGTLFHRFLIGFQGHLGTHPRHFSKLSCKPALSKHNGKTHGSASKMTYSRKRLR